MKRKLILTITTILLAATLSACGGDTVSGGGNTTESEATAEPTEASTPEVTEEPVVEPPEAPVVEPTAEPKLEGETGMKDFTPIEEYNTYFESEDIFGTNYSTTSVLSINDAQFFIETARYDEYKYIGFIKDSGDAFVKIYESPEKTYADMHIYDSFKGESAASTIYINHEDGKSFFDEVEFDSYYKQDGDIVSVEHFNEYEVDECYYDMLNVLVDTRTEEEKEMLAYETDNGIMYLSEGVSTTINGVKYGGEDGIQPLTEIPYSTALYVINRSTGKVVGCEFESNGAVITTEVTQIDNFELPSNLDDAVEGIEDDLNNAAITAVLMMLEFSMSQMQ